MIANTADPGSTFTVKGDHQYVEESSLDHAGFADGYHVIVTISHESATDTVVTAKATVSDPAVLLNAPPITLPDIPEGGTVTNVTVATFTDPGGPEDIGDYSATIDWGDGTLPETGTIFFCTSEPAIASIGIIIRKRPMNIARPRVSFQNGTLADRPANALPLLPVALLK